MPQLASDALAQLLDVAGLPVARDCAAAIRDGGKVDVWESWTAPASALYRTYRKRAKYAQRSKLEVRGIHQAVQGFKDAGDTSVGFAFVHGNRQEFSVWLRSDGTAVVACFSVAVPY